MSTFHQTAEKLLETDRKIAKVCLEAEDGDFCFSGGAPVKFFVCLGLTALCLIVFLAAPALGYDDVGTIAGAGALIFGILTLMASQKLWAVVRLKKEIEARGKQVARLAETHMELIETLNDMRRENPELAGRYWWDAGIDPMDLIPAAADWDSWPVVEIGWPTERPLGGSGEQYMSCYEDEPDVSGEDLCAMLQSDTSQSKTLYCNPRLIDPEASYAVSYLFSVQAKALSDVSEYETEVTIDKRAAMDDYRRRLDERERAVNRWYYDESATNEERVDSGQMDLSSYLDVSSQRSEAEERAERAIDARNRDPETRTGYRVGFSGRYEFRLLCRGVLYRTRRGGPVVMVCAPSQQQPIMKYTLKTRYPDMILEGVVEAASLTEPVYAASSMPIDSLASLEDQGGLEAVDLLGPKPDNMEDKDWAYIIMALGQ